MKLCTSTLNIKLEIRRNIDGVTATDIWPNWDYSSYWWREGNASCDCNREIFFLRAQNKPAPLDTKCSESKYSVRLSNADTGEILYDEFSV